MNQSYTRHHRRPSTYESRRRAAVRRVVRLTNGLMNYLLDRGIPVHGDVLVDFYNEELAGELAALEAREARRLSRDGKDGEQCR